MLTASSGYYFTEMNIRRSITSPRHWSSRTGPHRSPRAPDWAWSTSADWGYNWTSSWASPSPRCRAAGGAGTPAPWQSWGRIPWAPGLRWPATETGMQSMDALEPNANWLNLTYLLGDVEVLDVQHNEVGLLLHVQIDGDLAWPGGNMKEENGNGRIESQTIKL